MADLNSEYLSLSTYVKGLEDHFLKSFLENPVSTPEEYDLSVKSFCVLSHAAFEEFAEQTALTVMDATISNFISARRVTESLVSLMHFKSNGEAYLGKNESDSKIETMSTFDYIRLSLTEVKDRFSREVFNSHGVSLKYVKQLFMPVAVDIPTDVNLTNSLQQLSRERGAYAHKFLEKGMLKKSISPEDAKNIVDDCLGFFDQVRAHANTRI